MIEITAKFLFFTYKRIFFASELPIIKNKFEFVSLRQYGGQPPEKNWIKKNFTTLFTDLTKPENELFNNIDKGTRYKIKRAEREGVIFAKGTAKEFRIFFNNFAPSKGLKKLSYANILSYQPFSVVTQAVLDNTVLAMHLYLIDIEQSRIRLLYTATQNRLKTDIDLNLIGRANRFLHWKDMLLFKEEGMKIYDWGGIAGNPNDAKTAGIDAFKQAFGGYPISENHYDSPALAAIKKMLGR